MKIQQKIHQGIFLKRYKRFFADIEWQGKTITAHVPNTGSLKSVNEPGQLCLFSESDDPARKLKYTLEFIQARESQAWVGVNTQHPNALVKEALQQKLLKHWEGFDEIKPEYKISAETRFDFCLMAEGRKHFIEVKNVTLAEGAQAQFPDAVTERGQKHLRELMRMMEEGASAEIVFLIQRNDVKSMAPADPIDPVYGQLLREARLKGLKITPLMTEFAGNEISVLPRVLELGF